MLRGQKQFYHYSEKHTKNKSKLVIHAMHIELLTEIYNCMQLYDFLIQVGNREPFHKQPENDTFACNRKLEAFPARTGSSLQLCCTHAVLEVCTLAQF